MVYKNVLCLVVGLVIGIRLTDLWDYVRLQKYDQSGGVTIDSGGGGYGVDGDNSAFSSVNALNCLTSAGAAVAPLPTAPTSTNDEQQQQQQQQQQHPQQQQQQPTLSDIMYNETRVLCWIMTSPENRFHARNVLNTWGRRCNRLLFMSSAEDAELGTTIKLNVSEGRNNLWKKTREAFKYVYDHHFDDYDWFLKADDDTYVIMENLRLFLYPYASDVPVYFGCKFNRFVRQGYMSGGAGYVLSKEALRRFIEIGYKDASLCSRNQLAEDKEMGICLENVGVVAGDSRDADGQERFLPLAPKHLIPILTSSWYSQYLYYKPPDAVKNGLCCSHSAISFHYTKPKEFYMIDYLLYGLRPFAVSAAVDRLPPKANMAAAMAQWRKQKSNNVPTKKN